MDSLSTNLTNLRKVRKMMSKFIIMAIDRIGPLFETLDKGSNTVIYGAKILVDNELIWQGDIDLKKKETVLNNFVKLSKNLQILDHEGKIVLELKHT